MNILGIGVITLCLYGFAYYQNNGLSITKLKAKFNIRNKIRVLQLSDLHGKSFGSNNEKLFNLIIAEKPDIIVATGDLIDSNLKNMDGIIAFLVKLNEIIPVVYIPGNNENRCGKIDEIMNKLKLSGLLALQNEIATLNIKLNKVNVLGLSEELESKDNSFMKKVSDTYSYSESDKLFKRLEDLDGLRIVLSHYPENFEAIRDVNYSKYNFHIMFSGHAHGGQFILPFIGGVFAPGQGLFPKYYRGIYGESNRLVVSRGLGNSGFPLRLFNRPDIVVVDIE